MGKLFLGASFLVVLASWAFVSTPSDDYIRARVVKIVSDKGSCSGEQVRGPSGENYILTASHCKHLSKDGSMTVIKEDKKSISRRIIAEDDKSDLLLVEGLPNLPGLDIASQILPHQHVRTFTHGRGMDTYETEGVVISLLTVIIPSPDVPYEECMSTAKYLYIPADPFSEIPNMCAFNVNEMAVTAMVLPGSSGGPVVNDAGELVGVVSATDGRIGLLVYLMDVTKFLAAY